MSNTVWCIGWDVGAWHCDGRKSQDALVILNSELKIVGTPWRGNLRDCINSCSTAGEWSAALFDLCHVPVNFGSITLAIDTPLGFPDAFVQLLTWNQVAASIEEFKSNPYLFRRTESFLGQQGFKQPLSAIQDQIGSQATKGTHVLVRYALKVVECGVWSDGGDLTVIETYPTPCLKSKTVQEILAHSGYPQCLNEDDRRDALTCAVIAHMFAEKRDDLVPPEPDVSPGEGWIWIPKDATSPIRN